MDPLSIDNPPDIITAKAAAIHEAMLRESRQMREPNFKVIGTDDLARLFRLYDEQILAGWPSPLRKAGSK